MLNSALEDIMGTQQKSIKHLILASILFTSVAQISYAATANLTNTGKTSSSGSVSKAQASYKFFRDSDGDGYGDTSSSTTSTSSTPPSGYVRDGHDCNDADTNVRPGNSDSCNGRDDDCNGTTDDSSIMAITYYYRDADRDGYGDPNNYVTTCNYPDYVKDKTDCNDSYAEINPGVKEVCNAKDDNCDGQKDEGLTTVKGSYYKDGDKDGYGSGTTKYSIVCQTGYSAYNTDCNDKVATTYPGAKDTADSPDSVNNDCDSYTDDCDGYAQGIGPEVVITSPTRGSFLTSSSSTVKGYVLPSRLAQSISTVTVDGSSATLTQCSANGGKNFSKTTTVTKGVDTIPVVATDASKYTDTSRVSVMYSDKYTSLASYDATKAVAGLFNQGTWNILGDYLEDLLPASEVESLLKEENPIVDEHDSDVTDDEAVCIEWYDLTARIDDYTHKDFVTTFTVSGGKLKVSAQLKNPELEMSGDLEYQYDWWCGGWSDGLYVGFDMYATASTITASADVGVSVNSSTGKLDFTMSNVAVSTSGFSMDINSEDWWDDIVIDLVELFIPDEDIADLLEDEVESFLKTDAVIYLEDAVNSEDLSYTMTLNSKNYTVDFDYASASIPSSTVSLAMDMGLSYSKASGTPTNSGFLTYTSTTYSTAQTTPTFVLKTSYNFFNAALHALWEGGILNLKNYSAGTGMTVSTTALLPPVVTSSSTSGYLLKVSFGDIVMDMDIDTGVGAPYSLEISTSTDVNINLSVDSDVNEIWFDFDFNITSVNYDWVDHTMVLPDAEASMLNTLLLSAANKIINDAATYLTSLHISYADVPVKFNSFTIAKDTSNSAMISVESSATYDP